MAGPKAKAKAADEAKAGKGKAGGKGKGSAGKKPLDAEETATLEALLREWEDDECDNAGDFLTWAADFHDRDLGELARRYHAAVAAAAEVMTEVYGSE